MLQEAELAKIEIDVIADNLAQKFGGRVAKAPLKTKESSMRKIMKDYGGRASDMKDLARNTIIVPRSEIEQVAAELDKICIRVKRVVPDETGMGYSGINATYKSANGMFAEIQVNTPEMIFGKEVEGNAIKILGEDLFGKIKSKMPVSGGQGHAFYEEYRVLEGSHPDREALAQKSREYYNTIRGAEND